MVSFSEMKELVVCQIQVAQKSIADYQHQKQHAGSVKVYTRFHALQQKAKVQLSRWQIALNELENKTNNSSISDMKQVRNPIHVGALVKPVTSGAKGIVLSIHTKQGKQYAKIRFIGYYPRVCNYLLNELIILQPDTQDLYHIRQARLTYIPAH
jgi:hypothetical protein